MSVDIHVFHYVLTSACGFNALAQEVRDAMNRYIKMLYDHEHYTDWDTNCIGQSQVQLASEPWGCELKIDLSPAGSFEAWRLCMRFEAGPRRKLPGARGRGYPGERHTVFYGYVLVGDSRTAPDTASTITLQLHGIERFSDKEWWDWRLTDEELGSLVDGYGVITR